MARQVARVDGVTVATILQRYLESTKLHCRPRTIRTSEAAVRRLKVFFGQARAAEVSRSDCDRYSSERMAKGVGPHTPNRDLACLRAAFTQAKDDGLVERVPKIRMLRTVQGLPRILSREEVAKLLEAAGDLRVAFATAAGSGLRAAELRWLRWENINLDEGGRSLFRRRKTGVPSRTASARYRSRMSSRTSWRSTTAWSPTVRATGCFQYRLTGASGRRRVSVTLRDVLPSVPSSGVAVRSRSMIYAGPGPLTFSPRVSLWTRCAGSAGGQAVRPSNASTSHPQPGLWTRLALQVGG